MDSSLVIRDAHPRDAGALTALARRAKASWGYPASWLAAWDDELAFDAPYLARHRVRIAELSTCIAGVLGLTKTAGDWEIDRLWVDPAAQGRGAGRALVDDALAFAREGRAACVRVTSDPYAEPFYLRLGAVRTGAAPAPMPGAPERELPVLTFAL